MYREGRVLSGPLVTVRLRPNGLATFRFAVVAGKRVGTAVVRNRVRRRLREIARQLPIRPGVDLVFGARPAAATATFGELTTAVIDLLRRAKALGGVPADRQMATFPR